MPTSKDFLMPKKTSISEIKLNITATSPANAKKPQSTRSKKETKPFIHCGQSLPESSAPNTVSRNTISIQNIGSTDLCQPKPGIQIANPIRLTASRETSSKSTPVAKQRGFDFTSSTNSHFEGWILEVPKKFKRQCSTTTTTTKSGVSTSLRTSLPKRALQDKISTSREMSDSQHKSSLRKMNLKGPEWKKPCKESFVAGAPKPYIGTCPPNFEEIARMSKPRQKFFLTQDPRKKYCLRNPEVLRRKIYSSTKEFNTLTKMVKHADNICADIASHSSESFICDVVDVENPLNLDFQGMDYMNTYTRDEQEMQNQRVYRRVCRYMDRVTLKAETELMVENELHQERLAIPEAFAIVDRNQKVIPTPKIESPRIGKLYRSVDKPYNQERIELEQKQRKERYKNLYLRRKDKAMEEEKQREEQQQEDEEQRATTLATKNFKNVLNGINTAIEHSFNIEHLPQRKETKRRTFPHTMRETQQFKTKLKQENRIKRDQAVVKKEFYLKRLGKEKNYPEAELEISMDTPRHIQEQELSEQSSDDEDVLEVGKTGETFKLRGFHFKLGEALRGKRNQREKSKGTRKIKGCQTREQWLAQLAPKKEQIKLDIEEGIIKIKSPDDPTLVLFNPQYGFKAPKHESSDIRNYVQKRLARHYDKNLQKNLKLVKPRLKYSVKKFNLISFLYGDTKKRLENLKEMPQDVSKMKLNTTLEYMEAKDKMKQKRNQVIKKKRLKLLGLPCRVIKKSRLQTKCENSESDSDSDWVPDPEANILSDTEEKMKAREGKSVKVPLRMRGNMPAPKQRQSTLRRHPRHPRDYLGERVASQLFDEAVKTSGVPHLYKMEPDLLHYENIQECQKSEYTQKFQARHHHDHWNPTQKNLVDVHYQADIVHPETTKTKRKSDNILMENFRMANPPCNQFVNMDLTISKCNADALIEDHLKKSKKVTVAAKERTKDICYAHDYVLHSRPRSDFDGLDFPGRQEYLQFLNEIRVVLDTKNVDKAQDELVVDRDALIKELEEDLKSIESCLTSMSSSECTNLTNDSGSFLLLEGQTKVPLDYIRKSLVPFEELKRSRFQVVPIDLDAEESNPFKVLPFSGQKKAQLELTVAKDSFFTFNTRLKNGLRLRLEVPVEDVRTKLIGRGAHKFPGAVTTDIDENYVVELKDRPSVKMFNFKTGRDFVNDALRLKFESMLIQGQIVRTKIYDRLNEQHWEMMQKTKALYEKLFAKWEKREYEAAMSVVHKVKSYYETTDDLRREFREMERQILILNMDIVFIEGHWIQRIMLQNFHYLLGDQEWRYENDWIHKIKKDKYRKKYSEGEEDEEKGEQEGDEQEEENSEEYDESDGEEEVELESFEESIAKRSIVNCRQRDKDDAWAIKTYYEEVYLKNKHPILIVFPDASSFLKGIENLKLKTFVLLLELHFTLSIHTELQSRLETFEEWCAQDLIEKSEYVSRKCQKKYFMDDRAEKLKRSTLDFMNIPIERSYDDEQFNKDRAVIAEVWRQVLPANVRGSNDQDVEPTVMVAMMSEVVVELIAKFESIPTEESHRIEVALRRKRAYLQKQSREAYIVAKRIEMEMIKVRKNLEPPYQKKKRVGKLPRLQLKRKVSKVVVEERHVSEHTKFFFRAFHDEGDVMQTDDARDSLFVMDTIQEHIVPFYFDHFLKLNGYTPNYNFKTRIELRDGHEQDRVRVRTIIPEILEKMDKMEIVAKRTMEDNISRNPKMYENVIF